MEKKPRLMAIVLFLTGLICIGLLFGLSYKTYRKIDAVDQKMTSVIKPVQKKQKSMKEDIELYTAKIEKKQAANKYLQQRAQTEKAVKNNTVEHERAPEAVRKRPNPLFSVKPVVRDSPMAVMIPLLLPTTAISSGSIPDIRVKMLI